MGATCALGTLWHGRNRMHIPCPPESPSRLNCVASLAHTPHACPYTSWVLGIGRDENGSDTDGYHRYYICFHISVWIWIRIRIVSTMPDRIRLDIDIINMRFEYSDTDTVSDVEYPDSDMDRFKPL